MFPLSNLHFLEQIHALHTKKTWMNLSTINTDQTNPVDQSIAVNIPDVLLKMSVSQLIESGWLQYG